MSFKLNQKIYDKYISETKEKVTRDILEKRFNVMISISPFKGIDGNAMVCKIGKLRINYRCKAIVDIKWEDEDFILSPYYKKKLETLYIKNYLSKNGKNDTSIKRGKNYIILKEFSTDLFEISYNEDTKWNNGLPYYTILNKTNNKHVHCRSIKEIKAILKCLEDIKAFKSTTEYGEYTIDSANILLGKISI